MDTPIPATLKDTVQQTAEAVQVTAQVVKETAQAVQQSIQTTPFGGTTGLPATVQTSVNVSTLTANEITLQQVLIDSIHQAKGVISKGVDFALEQTPDIIHQALVWFATLSFIEFVSQILVFYVSYRLIKHANKLGWFDDGGSPDSGFIVGCIGVIALFMNFLILTTRGNVLNWLQIWIAPKIFLIEYASHLIKPVAGH